MMCSMSYNSNRGNLMGNDYISSRWTCFLNAILLEILEPLKFVFQIQSLIERQIKRFVYLVCYCDSYSVFWIFHFYQAIFMIPTNPPPTFRKPELWSDDFTDFVKKCLVKNPEQRATATQLLQVSACASKGRIFSLYLVAF